MVREATDICLRVLKERNKSRFNSFSRYEQLMIIFHITFWDCRVRISCDNLSQNSCIKLVHFHCLLTHGSLINEVHHSIPNLANLGAYVAV